MSAGKNSHGRKGSHCEVDNAVSLGDRHRDAIDCCDDELD